MTGIRRTDPAPRAAAVRTGAAPDRPRDAAARRRIPRPHPAAEPLTIEARSPMNTSVPFRRPPSPCPVCTHPGGDGAEGCSGCGRPAAPGAGHAESSGGHHDLTMRQDVRAAVRVGADGLHQGDHRVLKALLQHCRGLDRLSEEARTRMVESEQDAVARAERRARAQRRPYGAPEAAAARLAAGETDRLVLVETGPEGFATCTLTASAVGVVTADPVVRNVREWSDAVPSTGVRSRAEMLFLAAGGVGLKGAPPDPDTLLAWARELLHPSEGEAPGQTTEHVLIHRRANWLLPDLFAAAVRRIAPPVAEFIAEPGSPDLADRADALCAGVPLRRSYHLALASVAAPGGRVSVTYVELFPVGTAVRRGLPVETAVPVARPPGRAGPAALPVVVRGAGPDGEWSELTVARADIPVPGEAVVVASLERPGRVRLRVRGSGADAAQAGSWPQSWAELSASLPSHHNTDVGADVMVAVELGGPAQLVTQRLEVVRTLAHALRVGVGVHAGGLPGHAGAARLAAIGYADHSDNRRQADDPCRTAGFASPGELMAILQDWQPTPVVDQFAAPVEDALHRALHFDWRPGAQRTLVVVGSRPAGLTTRVGSVVHARVCPGRLDWAEALAELRARGVRTVAMVDEPAWMTHSDPAIPRDNTRRMWQQLGADGRFVLGSAAHLRSLADLVVPAASAELVLPVRAPGRQRDHADPPPY
ncbi:hypothetical protein [Streptodolium elevatio]